MPGKIGIFAQRLSSQTTVGTIIDKLNKLDKAKEEKTKVKSKGNKIEDLLVEAEAATRDKLSYFRNKIKIIKSEEDFIKYFDDAIDSGFIAIDTETNKSLDPLTCKLVGLCIYHEGDKAAYVPVNHTDMEGNRLDYQITEEQIGEQLRRLDNTTIIMHNGKFDCEVLYRTCGVDPHVNWDTMIGSQILDENESAKLKYQYMKHIDSTVGMYSIEGFYKNIPYEIVNPDIFALYAATDALETFELYKFQKKQFELPENERIYKLFLEVEMPVLKVAEGMENYGICIDKEFAKRLSDKYHKKAADCSKRIEEELNKLIPDIEKWRKTADANVRPITKAGKEGKSKNEQLKNPPELSSPTQFAILLYDVLKVKPVDKDSPRGTGEDILLQINHPLCKLVLEQRGIDKLLSTYIDKIPGVVNEKDGRLHAHFNQLGAEGNNVKTGRFSSTDPNLQNIPSHNKEIRMMFTASPGYVLVGSDFSQQEPRLFANYSQDKNMIGAYQQGKDLYATMGAGVYKMDYWDCMEHHQDGTANPEGKKRRSNMKALLLGR